MTANVASALPGIYVRWGHIQSQCVNYNKFTNTTLKTFLLLSWKSSGEEEETSRREIHLFSQHWHDARDLFLGIKTWRIGHRLELHRHLVVHPCHDVLELQLFSVLADHIAQWLDEPGPGHGIPPRVVACRQEWWNVKAHQHNVYKRRQKKETCVWMNEC